MSGLRTFGTGVGLVVAVGVLALRAVLTPVAERTVQRGRDEALVAEPVIPVVPVGPGSERVRAVRVALIGAGLRVLLVGAWKVLHAVRPESYGWLVVWLLGAIVLNDAVVAPLVVVLRALTHRALGTSSGPTLALIKAGFVVAGVLVLAVVPEIWAQHLGTANPTVLPSDYAGHLLAALTVIAALTVVSALAAAARTRVLDRKQRRLPPDAGLLVDPSALPLQEVHTEERSAGDE